MHAVRMSADAAAAAAAAASGERGAPRGGACARCGCGEGQVVGSGGGGGGGGGGSGPPSRVAPSLALRSSPHTKVFTAVLGGILLLWYCAADHRKPSVLATPSFAHVPTGAAAAAAATTTAASPPPTLSAEDAAEHRALDRLREGRLDTWAAVRSLDHLTIIRSDAARDAVSRACYEHVAAATAGLSRADREEVLWMCGRRGARLAGQVYDAHGTGADLHRARYADMMDAYQAAAYPGKTLPLEGAVHVAVDAGAAAVRRTSDSVLSAAHEPELRAALRMLRAALARGHAEAVGSADVFFVAGEGSVRAAETQNPVCPSVGTYPPVPVVKRAASVRHDPHHFALPVAEDGWDGGGGGSGSGGNESILTLPDRAVYRGGYTDAAAHLSFLSNLAGVGVDAAVSAEVDTAARSAQQRRCVVRYVQLRRDGRLPLRALGVDSAEMCDGLGRVWAAEAEEGRQRLAPHRYAVSLDGKGPCRALPRLLARPGVVLRAAGEFEEYYSADLFPFVHYVPIHTAEDALLRNVTVSLGYLRARPHVAQAVSDASSRWMALHKTAATDCLQWRLFFDLVRTLPPAQD